MAKNIKAIYEKGVLRPLTELGLGEREEVEIIILKDGDDIPAAAIAAMSQMNKSFSFLDDPEEDVYTSRDGEPV
jgi:predicted DNA-binding antitoxin AbrB/MazE fold protein